MYWSRVFIIDTMKHKNEKRIFIWYDVMYIWCVVWACETLGHIFKYCSVCNECECPPPRLHLSSLGANNRTTICQGGAAALLEGWSGPGVTMLVCGYQISMYTSMSKLGNTDNLSSNQENVWSQGSVASGLPRGGVEAGSGDHSSDSGWRSKYSQPGPGMDILSRNQLLFSHILNSLSSFNHKSRF